MESTWFTCRRWRCARSRWNLAGSCTTAATSLISSSAMKPTFHQNVTTMFEKWSSTWLVNAWARLCQLKIQLTLTKTSKDVDWNVKILCTLTTSIDRLENSLDGAQAFVAPATYSLSSPSPSTGTMETNILLKSSSTSISASWFPASVGLLNLSLANDRTSFAA